MKLKYLILVLSFLILAALFYTLFIASFDNSGTDSLPSEDDINENTTVVATGYSPSGGNLVFYNKTEEIGRQTVDKGMYFDVDPIGNDTLLFLETKIYQGDKCTPVDPSTTCSYFNISKMSLNSFDKSLIESRILPGMLNHEPHDIDKIGKNKYLVAGDERDRIFVVDENWRIEWTWSFKNQYNLTAGDSYPFDWAHVNDVEKVKWGNNTYYMASARNFDSVVFVNKETKRMNNSITLGSDDNFKILNRQHNPDFIPEERGGPALLIADSENDRVIEYQWNGSEWIESWVWSDNQMSWPRDADRLPNGNTLIVDSLGHRVIEVNQKGEIVWKEEIYKPYDAERLGTGDESKGGWSAQSLSLESKTPT